MIAEAPSAKAAAEFVLYGAVARFTGDGTPPGCLLASASASATATGSDDAADVRAAVAAMREELRASLLAQVVSDMEVGLLLPETEADALADGTICLIQGLSASTRDGPDRGRLDAMVRLCLRGWPRGRIARRRSPSRDRSKNPWKLFGRSDGQGAGTVGGAVWPDIASHGGAPVRQPRHEATSGRSTPLTPLPPPSRCPCPSIDSAATGPPGRGGDRAGGPRRPSAPPAVRYRLRSAGR